MEEIILIKMDSFSTLKILKNKEFHIYLLKILISKKKLHKKLKNS